MAGNHAIGCRVGNYLGQKLDGADCVVVTGDADLNVVRVTVGVEDGDYWDAQLLGLGDCKVLLVGVNNPERTWSLGDVANTAQGLLKLVLLTLEHEQFLLGEARLGWILEVKCLELLHARNSLGDG